MMKAYVNQSSSYEGSTVVVEHQEHLTFADVKLQKLRSLNF
jgi:hypothetical protein